MVLFLNDVAGSEILVILLFVLIFFGSKSIPTLAKTLGKVFRQINDAKAEIQGEIKKSSGNITKDLNLKGILKETEETISQPLDQMTYDIENSIKYERKTMPQNSLNNDELASQTSENEGSSEEGVIPEKEKNTKEQEASKD